MKHKDLMDKIQNALREERKGPAETHSYVRATALKVPTSMPQQTAPVRTAPRKTDVVNKEWNKEVKQTDNCSSHMETEPTPGSHLIPNRVHRWNIKNYSSIAKKMQRLEKSTQEMKEKVSLIQDEDKTAQENRKQDELWRDMMKTNEERQFRIGRIINYFS